MEYVIVFIPISVFIGFSIAMFIVNRDQSKIDVSENIKLKNELAKTKSFLRFDQKHYLNIDNSQRTQKLEEEIYNKG